MVSAELGCPTILDTHPKYAVALGAATLAAKTGPAPVPAGIAVGPPMPLFRAVGTPPGASPPESRPAGPGNGPAERPVPARPVPAGTVPLSAARGRVPRWLVLVAAGLGLLSLGGITAFVPFRTYPAPASHSASAPVRVDPGGGSGIVPVLGLSVRVGQTPGSIVMSPNGQQAYIANRDARTITVFDTSTNRVVSTVPIPVGPPQFLAVAPDGRRLYVSVFDERGTTRSIAVLDTASHPGTASSRVVATIPQPARPFQPAISPDGKRLWVPHRDISAVSVIDTATNRVAGQIKVAPNPRSVEFSADGTRAYVANESDVVTVIDTASNQVMATITVGNSPYGAAPSPTRPLVASVNYQANSVSKIDTRTWRVVANIPVGRNPRDIAWAPDGRFAYVVNESSKTVSVIDAESDRVTATISTGGTPSSIAVLANGRQAYVTNLDNGTVAVLDLTV